MVNTIEADNVNVIHLKNHSANPGSAGILPAFGGRDARAPRGYFIIWGGKTGMKVSNNLAQITDGQLWKLGSRVCLIFALALTAAASTSARWGL